MQPIQPIDIDSSAGAFLRSWCFRVSWLSDGWHMESLASSQPQWLPINPLFSISMNGNTHKKNNELGKMACSPWRVIGPAPPNSSQDQFEGEMPQPGLAIASRSATREASLQHRWRPGMTAGTGKHPLAIEGWRTVSWILLCFLFIFLTTGCYDKYKILKHVNFQLHMKHPPFVAETMTRWLNQCHEIPTQGFPNDGSISPCQVTPSCSRTTFPCVSAGTSLAFLFPGAKSGCGGLGQVTQSAKWCFLST